MTRVETHATDCPICATHPRHCRDREQAEFLDELQAAVKLWPRLPPHGDFCASVQRSQVRATAPCDCDYTARNEARAKAFDLLGIKP